MCNGTPFTVEKISPRVRIELGSLDQQASAQPTELPGLVTWHRCYRRTEVMHVSVCVGKNVFHKTAVVSN